MPDNKNENNDSLFTQMFGLESEQPTELPPKEEVKEVPKIEEPVEKAPEQKIIKANNIEETDSVFQNNLSQLNQTLAPKKPLESEQQEMTLSPTKKVEETIFLTDEPIKKEEEEKEEVIEEVKFDPNAIPTEPYDYKPSNNFEQYPLENASKSSVFLKFLLILLCVGGLIGGWILLYSTVLAPEEEINNTTETEEQETTEEETPEEPEVEKIEFSQSLSFYKGLTDNPDELNREYPYDPENKTGVVLCEFITPLTENNCTVELKVFLYYENYLTKKTYSQQVNTLKDDTSFQEYINAAQIMESNFTDSESLSIDSKIDYNNKQVSIGLFSNLAYGSYTNAGDTGLILKTKIDYDDNIKTAMAQIYGIEDFIGNIKCSTVKTS